MIDLSPPIHSQDKRYSGPVLRTEDFRAEAPPSDGPGGFAHILAGLLGKAPGENAGTEGGEKAPPERAELSTPARERLKAGDKAPPSREKGRARKGENPGEALNQVLAEQGLAGELFAPEQIAAEKKSPEQVFSKQVLLKQGSIEQSLAEENNRGEFSPEQLVLAESAGVPAAEQGVAVVRKAGGTGEGTRENPADMPLPAGAEAARQAAAGPAALPARENAPQGEDREKPDPDRKKAAPGDRAFLRDFAVVRDPALEGLSGQTEKTNEAGDSGDGPRGPAETRTRDKRRDRAALEVRDLRTGNAGDAQPAPGPAAGESPGREIGLSVDLAAAGDARDAPAIEDAPAASGLPDRLGRELREHLRDDIVRNASIVLRDGGEGTIRLALKPESLGNVKIRLEMTENKIAGKITVESEEAFRAFEQEIRALERAFRDSGFDGATLEMAVTADGGRDSPGRRSGEEAVPYFSSRLRQGAAYDLALEPGEGLPVLDGKHPGLVRLNMLV